MMLAQKCRADDFGTQYSHEAEVQLGNNPEGIGNSITVNGILAMYGSRIEFESNSTISHEHHNRTPEL